MKENKRLIWKIGSIAEQKILEAIVRGEAKNLPGEGKPLNIENLYFLQPEFKFAYTVLKNGGYLNLDDDKRVSVPSTNNDINLQNVNLINSTKSIPEKTLNYSIIRDCRRGKF